MSAPTPNHRILIVDDNRSIHDDFRSVLSHTTSAADASLSAAEAELFGGAASAADGVPTFDLDSAFGGEEAIGKVDAALDNERPYAMAFVDIRMPPGIDGIETSRRLLQLDPALQIVLCTAYSDYSWHEVVLQLGCSDRVLILKKPFDPVEVRQLALGLTTKWAVTAEASAKARALVEEIAGRRQAEADLVTFFNNTPELLCIATRDGWLRRVNPAWQRLLGYTEEELLGQPFVRFIHPDDVASTNVRVDEVAAGQSVHGFENRWRCKDGTYRWLSWSSVTDDSQSDSVYAVAHDITDRKATESSLRQAQAELQHDARHDRLTDLPNRAALNERLAALIAGVKAEPQRPFGLLFLDFDHFKVINDSLGHPVGDLLLQEIASRLRSCTTSLSQDRPASAPMAARLGGDEFVLLVEGVAQVDELLSLADHLQDELKRVYRLDGHEVFTSASIGIALGTADYDEPGAIIRDADTAMYHAKFSGRSRHAVFDQAMHGKAKHRLDLEIDLRKALDREQLSLVFQPLLSMETGRITGLEALLRWNHPTRGLVSPVDFVPVAEEAGLIVLMGRWVLQNATHQLTKWRRRFPQLDLAMSVNVARRQLAEPALPEHIRDILRDNGIPPHALKLEITESAVMEHQSMTIPALTRLKELGVGLWLDDFGTGYSSLSCLHTFPIAGLKIDRSFISNMRERRDFAAVVQAIVTLAHNMRMDVIAEGVESADQIAQLQALDCSFAQGYYFARPMPGEDVPAWIEQHLATVNRASAA